MKNNREKVIVMTSIISILSNIFLSAFKLIVGLISNSVAIITDAFNNLSDALSSVITIIGTKLAGKAPDKKHPFGYGRIEYLTSLLVSFIVLYAGITSLIESIKKIINPELSTYNTITIIILIAGIIVKFILGMYVKNKGKKVNSDSLIASGSDAFNDALLSISVLLSVIIYLILNISIESYVGILLSIFIINSGLNLIKDSVNNILGVRVESELARKIKKDINKEEYVQGAFDLILNNYGPDTYLGSVHIEVKDSLKVADIDRLSRRISSNIFKKYGVILHTIGIYSINTKDKDIIKKQKEIHNIVFSYKGILQMNRFFIDKKEKTISLDIVIDYNIKEKEELYQQIYQEIEKKYKDYKVSITLDFDISD